MYVNINLYFLLFLFGCVCFIIAFCSAHRAYKIFVTMSEDDW